MRGPTAERPKTGSRSLVELMVRCSISCSVLPSLHSGSRCTTSTVPVRTIFSASPYSPHSSTGSPGDSAFTSIAAATSCRKAMGACLQPTDTREVRSQHAANQVTSRHGGVCVCVGGCVCCPGAYGGRFTPFFFKNHHSSNSSKSTWFVPSGSISFMAVRSWSSVKSISSFFVSPRISSLSR